MSTIPPAPSPGTSPDHDPATEVRGELVVGEGSTRHSREVPQLPPRMHLVSARRRMIQLLLGVLIVLAGAMAAAAQAPGSAFLPGYAPPTKGQVLAKAVLQECAGYEAGTITPGAATAQSNDLTLDTLFMCFGDEVLINHNGDQRLDGDPDPSTRAGIGYIWYEGKPTVKGPTVGAVSADPRLLDNPNPDPSALPFIITTGGRRDGNQRFTNTGAIQNAFNAGDPMLVWFAPATFDSLDLSSPSNPAARYENGGSCMSVSTDAAFAVVYLNQLTASNVSAAGCEASFVVDGGVPEYRNRDFYTIEAVNIADPSVRATVLNSDVRAGQTVQLRAAQAGTYRVTIADAKTCQATEFTIDLTGCAPPDMVTLQVDSVVAAEGSTVCVPVRVEGFSAVSGFDFTLDYDEVLLRFDGIQGAGVTPFGAGNFADNGDFVAISASAGAGTFAPIGDGGILLEICFEALGLNGEFGDVVVRTPLMDPEFRDGSGTALGFDWSNGGVAIRATTVGALATQTIRGCTGTSSNAFTFRALGGTPPYSAAWRRNGQPPVIVTLTAENEPFTTPATLAPGDYTVIITDANGSTGSIGIQLQDAPLFGVVVERTSELRCAGDVNGALRAIPTIAFVEVSNPGPEYTFSWSTGATTPAISGLGVDNYTVTVTDGQGCEATGSNSITGKPVLTLTPTVVDASCEGQTDGSIELQATGGTPDGADYEYALIFPGGTAINRTEATPTFAAGPGEYFAAVADDNGCATTAIFTVDARKVVSLIPTVDSISCFGTNDAEITVEGSTTLGTATLPFSFTWFGPVSNDVSTPTRSVNDALIPGTYRVEASDADGCVARDTFVLTDPPVLEVTTIDSGDESCIPGGDGFATAAATGGRTWTQAYRFEWLETGTGNIVWGDSLAQNLSAGSYIAYVYDESGCVDSLDAPTIITAPEPPSVDAFADASLDCDGFTNGALAVSITATANPIDRIEWAGPAGFSGSGETQTGLAEGSYPIAIYDVAGCVTLDTAEVIAPEPLSEAVVELINPTCFEQGNGVINLTMDGGTAPYTYTWSNGVSGIGANRIDGASVTAGFYTVSVTDANDCPAFTSGYDLDDPEGIDPTETAQVAASCASGNCDGQLRVEAELPGVPGASFLFEWSSGETGSGTELLATQLCGGRQVLSIQESSLACPPQEFAYEIPAPEPLQPQLTFENVRCFGEANGRIEVDETLGGTPGFTYAWTVGDSRTEVGRILADIPADSVRLTVTDAAGCVQTERYDIGQPEELIVSLDQTLTTEPTCNGELNGTVGIQVEGGNMSFNGFAFRWNDDLTRDAAVARNLPAGRYVVLATDVLGCVDSLIHVLEEPSAIEYELADIDSIKCFGDVTTLRFDDVFGGQGMLPEDYQVSIDGGTFRTSDQDFVVGGGELLAIIIRDEAGCEATGEVLVPTPPAITVQLPDEVEVELGDSIRLRPDLFAGGAPLLLDELRWTPDTMISFVRGDLTSPFVAPLEETRYTLTVVDADGCTAEGSVLVRVDRNRNVFIPNAFSPNNDAVNDEFKIFTGVGVRKIEYLRIFDRWGEMVHEAEDLPLNEFGDQAGWDGMFRGRRVPMGTYAYISSIEFADGRVITYRGDVNVMY